MAANPKNHLRADENHSVCFRIYPRPRRSRLHCLVRIFDTRLAMTKGAAPYRRLLPKGFRAAHVAYYQRDSLNRLTPQRGEVFLCREHLDVGSVAHELLHVALAHARDVRLNLANLGASHGDSPEEAVAEMMDTLTSQLLSGCRRRGVPMAIHSVGGN